MNKKTLVSLVRKEAAKLKKEASKRERMRLDISDLSPSDSRRCIYGQMTGNCFSTRAGALIKSCAERVYDTSGECGLDEAKLNGRLEQAELRVATNYYSPIECFIYFDGNKWNGNNKILIDYLKGERKTLRFKKF